MLDDFFVRAMVVGLFVAALVGPFGCLLAWRRMSFMGESVAHSSILGLVLGFGLGILPQYAILIFSIFMALLLYWVDHLKRIDKDVSLSVIAHGGLGLGLFLVAFIPGLNVDLESYLFGSIFAIDDVDLYIVFLGGAVLAVLLLFYWKSLVAMSVSEELAMAEGLVKPYAELIFTIMIAVLIAMTMKITGLLLVSAILVIPAASARFISNQPEMMAVWASIFGMVSVAGGLYISLSQDIAGTASIIVVALLIFLFASSLNTIFKFKN